MAVATNVDDAFRRVEMFRFETHRNEVGNLCWYAVIAGKHIDRSQFQQITKFYVEAPREQSFLGAFLFL